MAQGGVEKRDWKDYSELFEQKRRDYDCQMLCMDNGSGGTLCRNDCQQLRFSCGCFSLAGLCLLDKKGFPKNQKWPKPPVTLYWVPAFPLSPKVTQRKLDPGIRA